MSPATTSSPPPGARPMAAHLARRLGLTAAMLAGLAGAWTFVVGHWLPRFLVPRIEAAAGQALGAPLAVQTLEIAPWTLHVRAAGVRLGPAEAPWLAVPEIGADVSPASLLKLAPVVRHLVVRAPHATLERLAPGRYNISPMLDALARPAPAGQAAAVRFELGDIALVDGRIDVRDRVGGREHRIAALQVRIPELRSPAVPQHEEVAFEVAAEVDGGTLQAEGRSRALRPDHGTTLALRWQQPDLARVPDDVAGWSGTPLPVSLQRGRLDAALQITLATPPEGLQLRVAGKTRLDDLQGRWPQSGLDFGIGGLTLEGLELEPLARRARIGSIEVATPEVTLDLARILGATPSPAASGASAQAAAARHWQIDRFALTAGQVLLRHPAWPAGEHLSSLEMHVEGLASGDAQARPAQLALSAADARGAHFHAQGHGTLDAGRWSLATELAGLQPAPWLAPWAQTLPLRVVAGKASAKAQLEIDPAGIHVSQGQVQLDAVELAPPGTATATAKAAATPDRLRLAKASVAGVGLTLPHAGAPAATVGSVTLEGLDVTGTRAADGRIAWLPPSPPPARPAGPAAPASPAPAWHVDELRCRGCAVHLSDLGVAPAARLALSGLELQAHGLDGDARRPVDFKLATTVGRRGRAAARGQLRARPLSLRSRVDVDGVNLALLQPYLEPYVNLTLQSARLGLAGDLRLDGNAREPIAAAHWQGRVALDDLRTLDRINGAEFLRFKRASSTGADLTWRPGGYEADLGTVALEGFYGRIILNADGRLNLRDILRQAGEAPGRSLTTPNAAAPAAAPPGGPAAAPPQAGPTPAPVPLPLRWQAIRLVDGEVDFTDLFIQPNYSARLTGVAGDVSALAWNDPQPAQIRVEARLDGSAPVTIGGTLHPLGARLHTDIRAQARGIDLTRLTTYATRYAGYGIEKGTLSADVHYRVDDGRLAADNKLVLDQLTFGSEKVEGPDVLKLPVLLAVSLLKDSKGVIDIDLPISGSLDDPKFSMGGIIVRVIVNLIERAVTAPFRLLAQAFGGGKLELSHVVFAPGSTTVDEAMKPALDTLAKALADRPALRLEITGRADPAADATGLRRAYLEQLLRQAKARATRRSAAEVAVGADERARWLEAAYRSADIPAKPRDLGGGLKALSDAEMEALLMQHAPSGGGPLATLADERAEHVKAYLAATIAPERLLVTASRPDASGITDKDGATRAEFALR